MPEEISSKKMMSLDELLTQQSEITLRATVEAIKGDADMVELTPYTSGVGCLCHLSINLPRASIKAVSPTGETHLCCGKTLRVVEIYFHEGQHIPLDVLFAQLSAKATQPMHSTHQSPQPTNAAMPYLAMGRKFDGSSYPVPTTSGAVEFPSSWHGFASAGGCGTSYPHGCPAGHYCCCCRGECYCKSEPCSFQPC